jgi:hypothetical protein
VSVTTLAARLPDIETVRRWSQSLAVLDAILSPEWQYRYFSFDARWADDQQMASMRNGSGNEYSITFAPVGAFLRGFDHESEMSPFARTPPAVWSGVIDDVPTAFGEFVREAAFSDDGVPSLTLCLWRGAEDLEWRHGPVTFPPGADPDGADWLFELLDGHPETYQSFARDYFELEIDLEAVRSIYRHEPLSKGVLSALNPDLSLSDLTSELETIGSHR